MKPVRKCNYKLIQVLALTKVCIIACTLTVFAQKSDSLKSISINNQIDTATVSAFREKFDLKVLPQDIQILNTLDINEIPNESVDELLKKSSGVDVTAYPGFQSYIGMRGFAPLAFTGTYTTIMLNGLPAGTQNPSTVDLTNAVQVEVLKGPYSSFFGSGAMAGVINIVTPVSYDTVRSLAKVSGGSYNTYSFNVQSGGSINKRLTFDLSIKTLNQNNDYKTGSHHLLNYSIYDREVMSGTYGQTFSNTRYGKNDDKLRFGYSFSKNWQINLFENLFVANPIFDNGDFWGITGSSKRTIERWYQCITLTGKSGIHSLRFSPYFSNENTFYYNNASDTGYVQTSNNYKSFGFVLQDEIKKGNNYAIFGIDNHSEDYVNEAWINKSQRTTPSQPDYLNSPTGVFLQVKLNSLNNKLVSSIGARYDFIYSTVYKTEFLPSENSDKTYSTFNPNINLKFMLLPELNIHASAGTAFLTPAAYEKAGSYSTIAFVYNGNPNLRPESSESFDAGITYENNKIGTKAELSFFDNKQNNIIVSTLTGKDSVSYANASSALSNGIEGLISYDIGSLSGYKYSLKIYANITWLFNSTLTNADVTSQMKYIRKYNASFGMDYMGFKSFKLRINGRFSGHRFEDNLLIGYDSNLKPVPLTTPGGTQIRPALIYNPVIQMPEFIIFDLSAGYTIANQYTFGLTLKNLLDENYTEKDGYNMPGREITLNIFYSF